MKIQEILSVCEQIRKQRKRTFSNYYNKYNDSDKDFEVDRGEGTIVFIVQDEFVKRCFFYSNNLDELCKKMDSIPSGVVLDYVCRRDLNDMALVFEKANWKRYAKYCRFYSPIPNPKEKDSKYNNLLKKLYDPNCGQPAELSDVSDIRKLLIEVFDPICDEILSENDLEKLIQNKWVWIYKVKGQICTLYIYRIEGKKRYGNITVNKLSANYLYNVTRNANEDSVKRYDIIHHYGWINTDNKKIEHTLQDVNNSLDFDGTENHIFVKE